MQVPKDVLYSLAWHRNVTAMVAFTRPNRGDYVACIQISSGVTDSGVPPLEQNCTPITRRVGSAERSGTARKPPPPDAGMQPCLFVRNKATRGACAASLGILSGSWMKMSNTASFDPDAAAALL